MFFPSRTPPLLVALALLASAPVFADALERISDDGSGNGANCFTGGAPSGSRHFSFSADGRYVAYTSCATNLVSPDDNAFGSDIYVYDRDAKSTVRISLASDGTQGTSDSFEPAVSADGRYVAFSSDASNLVPGDTNLKRDIFVHDRETGFTERVSVASNGTQANDDSGLPSMSADGRYVVYWSVATTLVTPDANGFAPDVFVHDRSTGATELISVASDGTQGDFVSADPSISADGRFVSFFSRSGNLVPGDTNGTGDVFVHDRDTRITERVSLASDGTEPNADIYYSSISANGRYVVFRTTADNLSPADTNGAIDVFVHDRETGVTERVSVSSDGTQGNADSDQPEISADGRYVVFQSQASNLVPTDANDPALIDIFMHDRDTGVTRLISVASDGTQGDADSLYPSVSSDGRLVAFTSAATTFAPNPNDHSQAYVKDTGESTVDQDSDGVLDADDNCPTVPNPGQTDDNDDGFGDACVSTGATISTDATIGANPLISSGVVIQKGVSVGDHAQIGEAVLLNKTSSFGDHFVADSHVIVGQGARLGDAVAIGHKSRIEKDVEIGNGVTIGEGVVLRKGTVIEDEALVDDFSTIDQYTLIGSGAFVGAWAKVGKNAMILPGASIPAGAVIGDDEVFPP